MTVSDMYITKADMDKSSYMVFIVSGENYANYS